LGLSLDLLLLLFVICSVNKTNNVGHNSSLCISQKEGGRPKVDVLLGGLNDNPDLIYNPAKDRQVRRNIEEGEELLRFFSSEKTSNLHQHLMWSVVDADIRAAFTNTLHDDSGL
jgi:hypothetical protein